jgi:hypothetical protein
MRIATFSGTPASECFLPLKGRWFSEDPVQGQATQGARLPKIRVVEFQAPADGSSSD